MDDIRDAVGAALGANCVIEDELLGGGMSRVFVARDIMLDRRVAVKVLPPELVAVMSVERFNREIMLSAKLQHPHIVPVLSANTAGAVAYYVMPFVEGESLRAKLARGPMSVREVVSIMRDVARALTYAHGRGIVHRDIKPDNILVSAGTATVTDFGLAKAVSMARGPESTTRKQTSTITRIGTSIGTPAYMAPEQAAGDPSLDHRADLYALGVVGYEMLMGTPPFHGNSPQQLLAAQLTEPPPPIAARRYDVPEALVALIGRLLEKAPNDRPRTAAEVVRALESPDVVSGAFASVTKPKRRAPKPLTIILIAAVVALSATVLWLLRR